MTNSVQFEGSSVQRPQVLSGVAVVLLRRFILVLLFAVVSNFILIVGTGRFEPRNLGFVAVILIELVCYRELSAGRVNRGLAVLCWGLWISSCVFSFIVAGIRTPFLYAQPVLLMTTAWVQGSRAAWFMAVLTLANLVAVAVAENQGWLPAPALRTAFDLLFIYGTVVGLAVALAVSLAETFQRLYAKDQALAAELRQRVTELDANAASLRAAEANLVKLNLQLEDRIAERTADLSNANEELKAANQKVLAADQAKSRFLASMSHELRTPLNAVLGFSGLLRNEANITPAQRGTLDLINRSGENLLNLINDVLDMSKIEAGGMVVENAALDLQTMVADIVALMRPRAEAKNLQLILDQSSAFPNFITGDALKLRQAMINLIGNAIKFTDEGGIALRLQADASDDPQRLNLVIEIQDSGVGISAEDQARVFDPFVQVGQHSVQKGTGLGLSITRKFVELMGGELSLESTLGEGSCFRIQIPVAPCAELAIPQHIVNRQRVIGLAPGQPDYRILIVEDQMENYLLLQRLMEGVGLQVRVAIDGRLGVAAFQSWRPHLIWMDQRMPVMSGTEATQQIRTLEGGREVRIVAVTASVFNQEREIIMAAGMDDFIRKPYRQDEIFDCLTRQLGLVFIREDDAQAAPESPVVRELTADDFASLPTELRDALRNAVVEMNQGKLAAVVVRIAEQAPDLAASVESMVKAFRFRELCELLDTVASPS